MTKIRYYAALPVFAIGAGLVMLAELIAGTELIP